MPAPIITGMPGVSPTDLKAGFLDSKSPQITTMDVEIGLSDKESVSEESTGAVPLTQQEVQQTSVRSNLRTSPPSEPHIVAYDGKTPPGPQSVSEICELIVGVLGRYRLLSSDDVKQPWGAKEKFFIQVQKYVVRNDAVCMALPAFPFKSPNKKTKVLGTLSDKGEEVALSHLEGLCLAIQDVYAPGAAIYIVSDGLMYNGELG
jgi:Pyoverdine/dityrosine biosynthesis protein